MAQNNEKHEQHENILFEKIMKFSAVVLHYNFHLPRVIGFAGHNYTAAYRDIFETLSKTKTIIATKSVLRLKRLFRVGFPTLLIAEKFEE